MRDLQGPSYSGDVQRTKVELNAHAGYLPLNGIAERPPPGSASPRSILSLSNNTNNVELNVVGYRCTFIALRSNPRT